MTIPSLFTRPVATDLQPYEDLVAAVASEAALGDLRYVLCRCEEEAIRFAWDDWTPEHYTNWRTVAERWAHHCTFGTLFWSVHYRGQHVIYVRNNYELTWMGPRRLP